MLSPPIWKVLNEGSFASIRVILPQGTSINCESDAIVTYSNANNVSIRGVMSGGFLSSIARYFLTNESFFTTVVENVARYDEGEASQVHVILAPSEPGGITIHAFNTAATRENDLLLIGGSYVASDNHVKITSEIQRRNSGMFSGTGLFVLRASGRGNVALSAYGSIHKFTLQRNEVRAVDNGHIIAWDASMNYWVSTTGNGVLSSITSGEGLMCYFKGPGCIYVQSHKPTIHGNGTESNSGTARRRTNNNNSTVLPFIFFMLLFCFVIMGILILYFKFPTLFDDNSNPYNYYDDSSKRYTNSYSSSSKRYSYSSKEL